MYAKYIKRIMDFILSLSAIVVLSPLLMSLTIIGGIKMKGNPFFTQERPGRREKVFKLIKFRTMTNAKDKDGTLLPDEVRLNGYGKFLRSTSLDELPELFNICKGDMSIIGPRPLLVQYLPYYTEIEKHRHDVRPGLSGLAQVNGRNLVKWDQRLAMDVEYVNNITFMGDVQIIFKTIKKVFAKEDIATDTLTVEPYLDEERKVKVSI
ncbi:sugar transferase [Selenomonas sp. ND2010]|uniref:sugar transferase n=1 Tax=Selenomonas sp. ND2010 TaxID=1410618 RepID=UPI00051C4DCF|nr:sugar transferase [Selenomonas sp. ND2010]